VPLPPEAKREEVRRFERPDGTVQIGNPYLYPEHYPLFGRLLADEAGFLWVMAYPVLREPISSWRLEIEFLLPLHRPVDPLTINYDHIG